MGRRRFELATTGADEGLQGLTSDPFPTKGTPVWTGLRIPTLVNTPTTRYLFLLDTRPFSARNGMVLGIAQGLEIGMDLGPQLSLPAGQQRPVSFPVISPTFRFSDGANVSWHLVKEPMNRRVIHRPGTDTQSFAFQTSDTPALLYQTFTAANVTPTGAPVNYPLDLTAYSPPLYPIDWQGIGGLETLHDIRYPWQLGSTAWHSLEETVEQGWRVSLYASVLQTNPATRPGIVLGTGIATNGTAVGLPPEEAFIQAFTFTAVEEPTQGPIFWRVYGRILFEDDTVGR